MDKFDRWGFGFWFSQPLGTPEKQEQTYDVREKFEWANKMGVSLQFDLQLNQTGSAEGILDDTGKRWGIELACRMGIPVFVQMQGIRRRDGSPTAMPTRCSKKFPSTPAAGTASTAETVLPAARSIR